MRNIALCRLTGGSRTGNLNTTPIGEVPLMKNLLKSFVLAAAMTMATAAPSLTTTADAGEGAAQLPFIQTAGLSIIVEGDCDSTPSFVAYFLIINGSFIYQGDTGWIEADDYNVTFPQWQYPTLPLALFAYSTSNTAVLQPTNPASLRNMGGTRVNGRIESGWLVPEWSEIES